MTGASTSARYAGETARPPNKSSLSIVIVASFCVFVYQKERRKILTPLPLGTNYINGRLDIEISEMSPKEREEKINALTDSQAISISKLIKDTLVLTRLPKDYSVDKINAVDAVYELYKESDYGAIDRKEIERYIKQSNQDSVGKIAKDFLLFLDVVADKDLL